jgi:hypothetical protein
LSADHAAATQFRVARACTKAPHKGSIAHYTALLLRIDIGALQTFGDPNLDDGLAGNAEPVRDLYVFSDFGNFIRLN